MAAIRVSYLGPEGTYAHQIARQRFGSECEFVACASVPKVFSSVKAGETDYGIVPIENSSGGWIFQTVDVLVDDRFPWDRIAVREALSIDVKLGLLVPKGANGAAITKVYSHYAALSHCQEWLDENLSGAEVVPIESTAAAARKAASDGPGSAAIASKEAVELHSALEIREFPIAVESPNVTQFLMVGERVEDRPENTRSLLAFSLVDSVGALCSFLGPFSENDVNLTRIISRTIKGRPQRYKFLIEIEGRISDDHVADAITKARAHTAFFYDLGSYPVGKTYQSAT